MIDTECVGFLQWALPQLHMRWPGFRKVRKQVCKRLGRHLKELGLPDTDAYRQYLAQHPEEWQTLDRLCQVVVTRFYRDKRVFETLAEKVLPELATTALVAGDKSLYCWSIGSASGEEPYTLAIVWRHMLAARFSELSLSILATERDPRLLARSEQACYPGGTIKNLPEGLRDAAFSETSDQYCLKPVYRAMVEFRQQDIRTATPEGRFHLILCRNLVFTYFDEAQQEEILAQLQAKLLPGGWLVVGVRETLPAGAGGLARVSERLGLYRKEPDAGKRKQDTGHTIP
jgi:chemotaxis protein methyltransferase CheR